MQYRNPRIDLLEETFFTILSNYEKENGIYLVHKGQFDPYDVMNLFLPSLFPDLVISLSCPSPLCVDEKELVTISLVLIDYDFDLSLSAWVLYDEGYLNEEL